MNKAEKLGYALLREANQLQPECQHFPDVFFPEDWGAEDQQGRKENYFDAVRTAKTYCGRCPIRTLCLEYALAANEQFGVWGGMSAPERRAMRRAARTRAAQLNQERGD